MKFSVWDALSILTLMGLCVVGIIVATIFTNPTSAFNPFPPPTLPANIVLPSDTPTPVYMPPTWTPVGANPNDVGKLASQTPLPTSTGFVLPTFTPTFTETPTVTETPTPTVTRTPTKTRVPNTNTPQPTVALVCLGISESVVSVNPPVVGPPAAAGDYAVDITVNGDSSHKVSGASVSFSTSRKTTVHWTCSGSNGSCHSSGTSFTVSSINMFANGSVTIHVTGVIPKGTKSGITFKSRVSAPNGTSNQCNPSASDNFPTW
jgi:hypothetical protein